MALDMLVIRDRGRVEGTLLRAGAREVRFEGPAGLETVPAWEVASIQPADAPRGWLDGRVLLDDARFADAQAAFAQVAGSPHRLAPWAAFMAWNAQRVQALVSGRGLEAALAAGESWLGAQDDDWYRAPALFMQGTLAIECAEATGHVTPAAERFRIAERCFQALDEAAFGPVWQLYARLGRARLLTFQKGVEEQVPAAFQRVRDAALQTPLAREVAQMAEAWLARWRVERGQARELMAELPRAVVDGQDLPACLSQAWVGSPATPVLLNAIGEALCQIDQTAGPVAALPFHLRVPRYYPGQHVEHARALAAIARGLIAAGSTEDGQAMRETLRARYPDSRWAAGTPVRERAPGD